MPHCRYRSCSWLPQELLVVQNIQVSYVLTREQTSTPCTTDHQPLASSGVDVTWHNSMQNQSTCTANLKGWGYVNIILEGTINYIKIHAKFLRSHSWLLKKLNHFVSIPVSCYYQFLIAYVLGAVLRIIRRTSKQRKLFNTGSIGQRSSGFFFSQKLHFNRRKTASFIQTGFLFVLFCFPKDNKTQKFLGKYFKLTYKNILRWGGSKLCIILMRTDIMFSSSFFSKATEKSHIAH